MSDKISEDVRAAVDEATGPEAVQNAVRTLRNARATLTGNTVQDLGRLLSPDELHDLLERHGGVLTVPAGNGEYVSIDGLLPCPEAPVFESVVGELVGGSTKISAGDVLIVVAQHDTTPARAQQMRAHLLETLPGLAGVVVLGGVAAVHVADGSVLQERAS